MTQQQSAFITGGASGLGKAIATWLAAKGIKVFIADRDEAGAKAAAAEIQGAYSAVDVTSWESQLAAFRRAVHLFGRIDYVYPIAGIGENSFLPATTTEEFQKPNLSIMDVNVSGLLYTVSLAVQQFRRQQPTASGIRGKIVVAGSVCGIYCCPSLPMYTTSKHAVAGLVRSLGKALISEGVTLNSVNPNVMRTNFSTDKFYDSLDSEGLLTPMQGCLDACQRFLDDDQLSGQNFEIGPNYDKGQGLVDPQFAPLVDEAQKRVFDKLLVRGNAR